jgi:hypothetical protein
MRYKYLLLFNLNTDISWGGGFQQFTRKWKISDLDPIFQQFLYAKRLLKVRLEKQLLQSWIFFEKMESKLPLLWQQWRSNMADILVY